MHTSLAAQPRLRVTELRVSQSSHLVVNSADSQKEPIHLSRAAFQGPPRRLQLSPCLLIVKQLFASLNEALYCKLL